MNTFFPTDQKKLRERIRRYERTFKEPHHDDGAGKRFLLGPLYLLMSDIQGALKSYIWYEKSFPDDIAESFNHLCWVLTLLRTDRPGKAKQKLRELVFSNLYVVPLILRLNPIQNSFRHYSNWSELSYVTEGPSSELFSLWGKDELAWLGDQWNEKSLQVDISQYIEIQYQLDKTFVREEREKLIRLSTAIEQGPQLSIAAAHNVIQFKRS